MLEINFGSQIFLLAQFSGSNVLNPLADFISSSLMRPFICS